MFIFIKIYVMLIAEVIKLTKKILKTTLALTILLMGNAINASAVVSRFNSYARGVKPLPKVKFNGFSGIGIKTVDTQSGTPGSILQQMRIGRDRWGTVILTSKGTPGSVFVSGGRPNGPKGTSNLPRLK